MKNELKPLMTLRQAAELLFGDAGKVRALRTEIDKGNLISRRIANTFYVSEQDLREMSERCLEKPKARISTGTKKKKSGLSEMEPDHGEPDVAIRNLKARKFNSQTFRR